MRLLDKPFSCLVRFVLSSPGSRLWSLLVLTSSKYLGYGKCLLSPTHRRGAAASQNQPPALLSLTLGNSLQLQDLGISWQPQALSPLTWHPTKGIKGLGSRGHHSALRSFCPFLSIPCLPTKKLSLLSRSVSLIQFLSSPPSWEGTYSCPLQTLPRQKKDERSHPHPKHSPWLPSPQYLAPAPSSRLWLASESRPAGPVARPGRRIGPLPLSARSRCLGNVAPPPSCDPSVGPATDHVT